MTPTDKFVTLFKNKLSRQGNAVVLAARARTGIPTLVRSMSNAIQGDVDVRLGAAAHALDKIGKVASELRLRMHDVRFALKVDGRYVWKSRS